MPAVDLRGMGQRRCLVAVSVDEVGGMVQPVGKPHRLDGAFRLVELA
jgi:hypothetical protein